MKIGYSMLLGEYMDAVHIEYEDCKGFQIVCPSCYEAIFKVVRNSISETGTIDYLSHYSTSRSYEAECELRSKNLSSVERENHNSISRNQRLRYFLAVLQEMIAEDPIYSHGYKKPHKKLNLSEALKYFRSGLFSHCQKQSFSQEEFNLISDEYISHVEIVGGTVKTDFSISVQKRIAYDVWKHLVSDRKHRNFDFLFNHGYITLIGRIANSKNVRDWVPEEEYIIQCLIEIVESKKSRGMQILGEMLHTPVGTKFAIEGSDFLSKTSSEIMHEMVGTLISLPYFSYLEKHQQKNTRN